MTTATVSPTFHTPHPLAFMSFDFVAAGTTPSSTSQAASYYRPQENPHTMSTLAQGDTQMCLHDVYIKLFIISFLHPRLTSYAHMTGSWLLFQSSLYILFDYSPLFVCFLIHTKSCGGNTRKIQLHAYLNKNLPHAHHIPCCKMSSCIIKHLPRVAAWL